MLHTKEGFQSASRTHLQLGLGHWCLQCVCLQVLAPARCFVQPGTDACMQCCNAWVLCAGACACAHVSGRAGHGLCAGAGGRRRSRVDVLWHERDLETTVSRWCVTLTESGVDKVIVTHHLENVVARSRLCLAHQPCDRHLTPRTLTTTCSATAAQACARPPCDPWPAPPSQPTTPHQPLPHPPWCGSQ